MSEENQVVEEEVKVDVVEGNPEDAGADDQPGDGTPDWMQDDEPEPDKSGDDNSVPAAKHASIKSKLKKRVSRAEEDFKRVEEENKALRAKLEGAGQQPAAQQQPDRMTRPVMPLESEHDYDPEKYRAAYDKYLDEKERYDDLMFQNRQQRVNHEEGQRRKADEYRQTLSKANDDHFDRAAKLCEADNIDADLYRTANDNFRDAITRNLPEGVRAGAFETILSRLGPGSEKIAYKFGHNAAYRAKLEGWVREDPQCMKLMLELGAELKKVNNTVPRKSKANPPAATATGGNTSVGGSDKMLKQYLKAKDSSHQAAMDIKQKAREAGVDVSDWYLK